MSANTSAEHADPCPDWGCRDHPHKVLLPRDLRRFDGRCSGHRVRHVFGDPYASHGVGILLTAPFGHVPDLPELSEAEYAKQGDWLVYAAPNELTNPYVIAAHDRKDARRLGRTYESRAKAIAEQFSDDLVDDLRKQMPFVKCDRCGLPTELFRVSDAEWARVGPEWSKTILCVRCYAEVVGRPR